METYEAALKLITQNCFMASLDIKDAYLLCTNSPNISETSPIHLEW